MDSKKSFRVELENDLHEKLHRIAHQEGKAASDLFREWLDLAPEPSSHLMFQEFGQKQSRLVKKLVYWRGKDLFKVDSPSVDLLREINKSVEQYVSEIVFADSIKSLEAAFRYWDRKLTTQEKKVVGQFFPFSIKGRLAKHDVSFFTESNWYDLKDGEYVVFQEPVFGDFASGGRILGEVTKNKYGAYVLNSHNMMILDVDLMSSNCPYYEDTCLDSTIALNEEVALCSLRFFCSTHPEASFRIYRTAKGLRYIRTDRESDPRWCWQIGKPLMADPRYLNLCSFQETFRARLTPKPWRVGLLRDEVDSLSMEDWKEEMGEGRYRVCEYVTTIGSGTVIDVFEKMIHYHDELTRSHTTDEDIMFA